MILVLLAFQMMNGTIRDDRIKSDVIIDLKRNNKRSYIKFCRTLLSVVGFVYWVDPDGFSAV